MTWRSRTGLIVVVLGALSLPDAASAQQCSAYKVENTKDIALAPGAVFTCDCAEARCQKASDVLLGCGAVAADDLFVDHLTLAPHDILRFGAIDTDSDWLQTFLRPNIDSETNNDYLHEYFRKLLRMLPVRLSGPDRCKVCDCVKATLSAPDPQTQIRVGVAATCIGTP